MTADRPSIGPRLHQWGQTLLRHLLLEIAVALSILAGGAVYVLRMPDVFRAETRILVNPQRVSDRYVSSAVSTNSTERLNTLSQQVLSSSRLEAILEDLNLYPKLRSKMPREKLLDRMRSHIGIELKQSSDGPSSFALAFTGDSAQEVAEVTKRLAASFISWNLQDRQQEAQGTTAFLSKQLADTKAQLDHFEEGLRAYKLQHLGELPDQLQANMQALSRLQVQLQANIDAQSRLDHESFLANVETLPSALDGSFSAQLSPRQRLAARTEQCRQELEELRRHYTAAFPDVRRKMMELRALETELASFPASPAGASASATSAHGDPRQQLISRDAEHLRAAQRDIEAAINMYQARVNAEPIREQEISQLLRDYNTAKEHYNSLLEKTYSAQMAADLERRQEGGSFTLLDPARVPEAPIGPDRVALLIGVSLFSVVAGIGAGVLRELLNSNIKSEEEVRAALPGVPFLGLTPRLSPAGTQASAFVPDWFSKWSKS